MDLVSNYIGSLSSSQFGDKSGNISPNSDLNDNTFENILNDKLSRIMDENKMINSLGELGMPAGINIADFNENNSALNTNADNLINSLYKSDNSQAFNFKNNEYTTSDILTFFSSVFDSKPTMAQNTDSGLFSFERKLAANSYGKYARNIITDLSEFVTDTMKMKS